MQGIHFRFQLFKLGGAVLALQGYPGGLDHIFPGDVAVVIQFQSLRGGLADGQARVDAGLGVEGG
ncbi:hypothetical protein D3C85_1749610 [compost metagenome]